MTGETVGRSSETKSFVSRLNTTITSALILRPRLFRATLDSGDLSTLDTYDDAIETASVQLGKQELQRARDEPRAEYADTAGDILDEMSFSIDELRIFLVEYEGDIHYAGAMRSVPITSDRFPNS